MDNLVWALPLVLIALACALMIVGMMAFGSLATRGLETQGGHAAMMCHGGHGDDAHGREAERAGSPDLVAELRAQRERLDQLIARAERNEAK